MNKKTGVIIAVLLIVAIGLASYYFISNPLGGVLKDRNEFFSLKVPSDFSFIENDYAEEDRYDLAVYDRKLGIYIFGHTYTLYDEEEPFIDYVTSDKDDFIEAREGHDGSEINTYTKNNYDFFTYNYMYTDEHEEEYYIQVVWINTKYGTYYLELECPVEIMDTYKEVLDTIASSFKEL